jgi:hypothetical protein
MPVRPENASRRSLSEKRLGPVKYIRVHRVSTEVGDELDVSVFFKEAEFDVGGAKG